MNRAVGGLGFEGRGARPLGTAILRRSAPAGLPAFAWSADSPGTGGRGSAAGRDGGGRGSAAGDVEYHCIQSV